ncbi:MAG: hypothetical protein NTV59_01775, partial [Chloroflexi bacterium]|nr:hypothetical protein [Chloroflexota bacterium]
SNSCENGTASEARRLCAKSSQLNCKYLCFTFPPILPNSIRSYQIYIWVTEWKWYNRHLDVYGKMPSRP